jgi:hypothetical protein
VVVPVVLAALFAPVCHGQLAPPTPVEQAMAYRRQFGLPSGRAYVRRVQRSGARRDDQGFAFTRREWRYWEKRSQIEDTVSRTDPYVDRRASVTAGVSIEDDWPEGPYLLVRVTRDRERHQAALRRIYPYRLRTAIVQFSGRELGAVQDRISADADALAAEGFDVRGLWVDTEANRVRVQMVSSRADHQGYFEARYGPAVTTFATAEPTRLVCTKVRRLRVSSTGRSLRVHFIHSRGETLERVELAEHDDRVEIGVVLRVDAFFRYSDARLAHTRVPLSRPLGDRRVIDAATGLRRSPAR